MFSQSVLRKSIKFDLVKSHFTRKWENLNEQQQNLLKKSWSVITYRWRWQIALNIPYLLIFILDRSIPTVHAFNLRIIHSILGGLPFVNHLFS